MQRTTIITTKYKNSSRTKTPWDNVDELDPLEEFIKSKYLDSFHIKHPKLKDTDEAKLINSYTLTKCKRCNSKKIKKKGFTNNGIQRYQCNDCGSTFNVLTNTLFSSHKILLTEWIEFCLDIFRYESINITAKTNKNSYTTSKYWLCKLFLIVDSIQEDTVLSGKVYIDETFFPVIKSEKIMTLESKELRGVSKNQYCIGVGYDGIHVYAKLEGMGKPSKKKTLETFINHIQPKSHLIHNKEKSHKIILKDLQLTDESYHAKVLKKLNDTDNPLYPIDHICYLLKRFLRNHDGFY